MKAVKAIEETQDIKLKRVENRVPRWVLPSVKFLIGLTDAVLAAICFFIAFKLREGDNVFSETAWAWSKEFVPYAGVFWALIPIRLAMLIYPRNLGQGLSILWL